jgi:hypothetical protein
MARELEQIGAGRQTPTACSLVVAPTGLASLACSNQDAGIGRRDSVWPIRWGRKGGL